MEKWKIAVIGCLLIGLIAYPAYQQIQANDAAKTTANMPAVNASNAVGDFNPNQLIQQFVGKPLPAWNIAPKYWMNTAKPLEPSDFKGHVTIVEFFRIKCSHCQASAPVLRDVYERFKGRGLRVVGIQAPSDKDPDENNWNTVASVCKTQFGLNYPIAFDEKAQLFKNTYNGKLYPSIFLLNRQGIVVFAQTGFDYDREKNLLDAMQAEMHKK